MEDFGWAVGCRQQAWALEPGASLAHPTHTQPCSMSPAESQPGLFSALPAPSAAAWLWVAWGGGGISLVTATPLVGLGGGPEPVPASLKRLWCALCQQ